MNQILLLSLSIWVLLSTPLYAGQLQIAVSDAPYYAGVPIDIQIHASGFASSPQPEITVTAPDNAKLILQSVTPNISQSIQIINGNVSKSETVLFIYHYQFLATKPDKYRIGPFTVTQNKQTETTQTFTLTIEKIPLSDKQRAVLVLPESIYIGQQAEVQFQWWVDKQLQDKLMRQQAIVPFFDQVQDFQFIDTEQDDEAKGEIKITTDAGTIKFPASVNYKSYDQRLHIVQTVKRQFIPLKAGKYKIAPAIITVDEITAWQRSFFGRRPAKTRTLRAIDQPHTLWVKSIPENNRPASFSGAVGNGFTLSVSANRSVVQVGDPIMLTITLHGDNNVENIGFPDLSNAGLSTQNFRLPKEHPAGIYNTEKNTKQFTLTIRVLDDKITAIPPLHFAWFNPDKEQFITTQSEPIALSVKKAKMISAQDVVSANAQLNTTTQNPPPHSLEKKPPQTDSINASKMVYHFSGANLAIEKDRIQLLTEHHSNNDYLWQGIVYLLGIVVLILAIIRRRQMDQDPAIKQQQQQLQHIIRQLKSVHTAQQLAHILRELIAHAPAQLDYQTVDSLLEHCDNMVYAPTGKNAAIDTDMKKQVKAIIIQLEELKV